MRAAEVSALLRVWQERPHASARRRVGTMIATDFNEQRAREYSADEWSFLTRLCSRGADGVHDAGGVLEEAGFRNVSDLSCERRGPFSKAGGAPVFPHWTGTTFEHTCLHDATDDGASVVLQSVHTLPRPALSDHLATVVDLQVAW